MSSSKLSTSPQQEASPTDVISSLGVLKLDAILMKSNLEDMFQRDIGRVFLLLIQFTVSD